MLSKTALIVLMNTWKNDLQSFVNNEQSEDCIIDVINNIDITIETIEEDCQIKV
jgi:hypothetical protein